MSATPSHQSILIVDFGSQVTQLIARRLRELNVYCEIHPYQNVTADFVRQMAPKAVIFSCGPCVRRRDTDVETFGYLPAEAGNKGSVGLCPL